LRVASSGIDRSADAALVFQRALIEVLANRRECLLAAQSMLPSFLLAGLLMALGAGLLAWHIRVWRAVREREPDPRELAFCRRQFHRRRQTAVAIGLLGAALAGGEFMRDPVVALAYWTGTMFLVLWILLLGLLDLAASQQHLGTQRAQRDAEEAILLRQFRKDFGHRQNGHPPSDASEDNT
jgi:hypothetical protein